MIFSQIDWIIEMPDTLTNNAKYWNAYMLKLMSNSTRNIELFC